MHARQPARLLSSAFALWLAIASPLPAAPLQLFDAAAPSAKDRVRAQQATLSFSNQWLRLATPPSETWPGITLSPPGQAWDLSPYDHVLVTLRNAGTNPASISCRVDNPGADGTRNCLTGSVTVQPGKEETLRIILKRSTPGKLDGKLFGMRGYPVQPGGEGTIDPAKVNQVLVFLNRPKTAHFVELRSIVAEGQYVAPTAWVTDADPYLPMIDTFGQYKHKSWPGKLSGLDDLRRRREQEAASLKAKPGPAEWNQYGGWTAGPQLKATGWFRTEKHQGKWWLVDPEGRLFWSHGIDCVRLADLTAIEEREHWFENPPWELPELAEFVSKGYALKGHYAGRSPKAFSFASANLRRKYGADWKNTVPPLIHQRLRAWGVNTIGNWSDDTTRMLRRTPYVDTFGTRGARTIEGSEGYWAKFPDVYDPSFKEAVVKGMAPKAGRSAGDPWCLGFFSDNEMSWGDELSIGNATLKSPPEQPAKQALVRDLQAKYTDIARLNKAWDAEHTSWDALLQSRTVPDPGRAGQDLRDFYRRTAETYFREARDAVRAVAPHQLYLGCRFAWVNSVAAAAAAKYCDVVSYNIYKRNVRGFEFNGGADVPLIIGEFHFGALDRGMFHTGLVSAANQDERAQTYRDYLESALEHPQFVGCHWFQYQDQPTTGRIYDEENYQIGFVDITDTPYPEIIRASQDIGSRMYTHRLRHQRE